MMANTGKSIALSSYFSEISNSQMQNYTSLTVAFDDSTCIKYRISVYMSATDLIGTRKKKQIPFRVTLSRITKYFNFRLFWWNTRSMLGSIVHKLS